MHTMDSTSSSVPAFITKLWKLVEDVNYDHLIQWNQNGRSFIIQDQSKFAKELLPLYFKHSNMASFIRQLNMYGFRKVSNIENSGLRSERDDIEFFHQFFVKGKEFELENIKRKSSQQIASAKSGPNSGNFKQEDMSDILSDMECLKGKQDSVDGMLTNMQRENEALWREVAILRQKHHKQQQIVEKLIQFLVSLVQNRGLMGIKRKAQLMIDASEENRENTRNKVMKRNENFPQEFSPGQPRSNGPIIHDITDDDLEETIISAHSPIISTNQGLVDMSPNPQVLAPEMVANSPVDQLLTNCTNPNPNRSQDFFDPLQESIKELGLVAEPSEAPISVDNLLSSTLNTPIVSPTLEVSNIFDNQKKNCDKNENNIKDLVISTQNNDQMRGSVSPLNQSALNEHVDGIEAELDWLQDQLSSGINIDASTLLGVRSDSGLSGLNLSDNIWLKQLFSMDENSQAGYLNMNGNNAIIGNEIIQFNPNTNSLFDDLDLDQITATDEAQDSLLEEQLLPDLDAITEGTVSFPPDTGLDNGKSLKRKTILS